MYFAPIHARLPESAEKDMATISVDADNQFDLPAGDYLILENYCMDPECDCRKVMINIVKADDSMEFLATISYGWEDLKFYRQWLKGDTESAKEMKGPSLELGGKQSEHAQGCLALFEDFLTQHPEFTEQVKKHYFLFKETDLNESPWGDISAEGQPIAKNKTGRNDLCPCGSGKKFKKCCLEKDALQQLRCETSVHRTVTSQALEFIACSKYADLIREAKRIFSDFAQDFNVELDDENEEDQAFFNEWMLNDYMLPDDEYANGTLFWDLFFEEKGDSLTEDEFLVADNFAGSHRTLYEVEEVQVGQGIKVKDVFSRKKFFVKELRGSWGVTKWDIICARVVLDEQDEPFFSGNVFSFPRQKLPNIKKFLSKMKKNTERKTKETYAMSDILKMQGCVLFFIYKMMRVVQQNFLPEMRTTTGEACNFCAGLWTVKDYQNIFDILEKNFERTSGEGAEEELFLWLNEERTILASFELWDDGLKVETKSKERLEAAKEWLAENAAQWLEFEKEVIESPEEAMRKYVPKEGEVLSTEWVEMPEGAKEELFQERRGNWKNTPIPILDDQTPLEAMQTKKGKRKLRELFKMYESMEEKVKKMGGDAFLSDTKRLKEMIGWEE